jgi:hypothetical protein
MLIDLSLFDQTLAQLSPAFGSDLIASLATYLEVPQENIEAHTYSERTNGTATHERDDLSCLVEVPQLRQIQAASDRSERYG